MSDREPFTTLTSQTIVVPYRDVDTDQIVPARFLTMTSKDGLADAAFHDWRFDEKGQPKDSPLTGVDFASHKILVAGDNFGCGSSREHAPWALEALGIKVVISSRIADIFKSNALKNGVLTVEVDKDTHQRLLSDPGAQVTVDLDAEELRFGNHVVAFRIEPFARRCLLEGTDSLGMLMFAIPEIEAYEARMGR